MKNLSILKIMLFVILILKKNNVSGQELPVDSATGMVVFSFIVKLDSTYTADRIYLLSKEWFSSGTRKFNRSNGDKNYNATDLLLGVSREKSIELTQLYKIDQPLTLSDPDNKRMIGRAVLKYSQGSAFKCVRVLCFEYIIKISIKDYKMKFEITDYNYTHYNPYTLKQQYFAFDAEYCKEKGSIEELIKCKACPIEFEKVYSYLWVDAITLLNDMKSHLWRAKVDDGKW